MDDMSAKIEELLNRPDAMEKLSQAAQSLFGDAADNTPSGPDGVDAAKVMEIIELLKKTGNDDRSKLLIALKPHLSPERQARIDTAVKILNIVNIAPALKDQGIL